MRDPRATFERFEKVAEIWISSLDSYTPEQFAARPAEDSWSIGQVYQHLVSSARDVSMKNIELCIAGQGEQTRGGKSTPGRLIFTLRRFPPTRIRVPASKTYTPPQPESPAAVKKELTELVGLVRDARDRIARAPASNKVKHPALGMLNAGEWYQLIDMHYRHHLRQKERIDRFLGVGGITR